MAEPRMVYRRHGSVTIGVPVDDRAARTRHPDSVALDTAAQVATAPVLLEEGHGALKSVTTASVASSDDRRP